MHRTLERSGRQIVPGGVLGQGPGVRARLYCQQVRVPEVSATMHLYPINGACHDVASDETAFAYRDATLAMVIVAAWQDAHDDESRIRWVRDYYKTVAPHSEIGGYVNFMGTDDQGKVQDNYGANYQRLVAVKRTYDPDNFFHLNQNIDPGR
jgi:hypothetical protein